MTLVLIERDDLDLSGCGFLEAADESFGGCSGGGVLAVQRAFEGLFHQLSAMNLHRGEGTEVARKFLGFQLPGLLGGLAL